MRRKILIYLLLFAIAVAASTFFFLNEKLLYSILAIVPALYLCFLLIREYKSNSRKITYMLNALENDDTSFRFASKKRGDSYDKLFIATLNRINEMLATEKMTTRENEKYYELMMANVITGLITIDEQGNIFDCNNKALQLLGLPVLTHISQLQKVDESLYELLSAEASPNESRTVSFYNESGEVNLSLKYSLIIIRGKKLKLVAINDIGRELEEKEQDSWIRLIRMLTHEIMNTVSPISSLSETLSEMVNRADDDENIKEEVKNGLGVITASSKGLISFVDSYRSMTKIPTPTKRAVLVSDLLHRVLTLLRDDMESHDIVPEVTFGDTTTMIYADENLISQVLINLIKNAMAAILERMEQEPKLIPSIKIKISIDPNNEDVIMEVSNNGAPISKENQDHIFVPFFTTKASGTGIGLSLSRQIMRLHDGSLKLKCSNETETAFVLIFR